MKIATWNINGLRSGMRAGFEAWLTAAGNDIVCLQEVKTEQDLLGTVWFPDYTSHWFNSTKRGYSGVVTLVSSKLKPVAVRSGIGHGQIDGEGRVLAIEFDNFEIVNVYAPHSHRQLTRLSFKLEFLACFTEYVSSRKNKGKPLIVVGDLNVAHDERDVANFASNRKNAGFRPEERAWLTEFLGSGFVDAFRAFNGEAGHYTWWSPIKGVRERNIGWRLDYILVDTRILGHLKSCFHSPSQTGSDHCPVSAELDI